MLSPERFFSSAPAAGEKAPTTGATTRHRSKKRVAANNIEPALLGRHAERGPLPAGLPPGQNPKRSFYCCCIIIRITRKKNRRSNNPGGSSSSNIFVNVTNLKGQTLIKFSFGLLGGRKGPKLVKRTIVKFIMERISFFVKNNFDCVKITVKGHTSKSFSYFKEFKRRKLTIVSFRTRIPVLHNGCRPPSKRRV